MLKPKSAAEFYGVSVPTIRRWCDEGKLAYRRSPCGQRVILLPDGSCQPDKLTIFYSRVSSAKQRNDLERQQQYLHDKFVSNSTETIDVSDIGSGLNFKRRGLLRVLGLVKEGRVQTIVVASKDRLARFGIELIEWMCVQYQTKIVVLDKDDTSPSEELGKDLLAIVQVYCCRWNGSRRYKSKTEGSANTEAKATCENVETTYPTDDTTKEDAAGMGRRCPIHVQQDFGNPEESQKQLPIVDVVEESIRH